MARYIAITVVITRLICRQRPPSLAVLAASPSESPCFPQTPLSCILPSSKHPPHHSTSCEHELRYVQYCLLPSWLSHRRARPTHLHLGRSSEKLMMEACTVSVCRRTFFRPAPTALLMKHRAVVQCRSIPSARVLSLSLSPSHSSSTHGCCPLPSRHLAKPALCLAFYDVMQTPSMLAQANASNITTSISRFGPQQPPTSIHPSMLSEGLPPL